jgi:hypothetical protein
LAAFLVFGDVGEKQQNFFLTFQKNKAERGKVCYKNARYDSLSLSLCVRVQIRASAFFFGEGAKKKDERSLFAFVFFFP